MSKIAALQISHENFSNARVDYYVRICKNKQVEILLLSEYAINDFFVTLKNKTKEEIQAQSDEKIKFLQNLSKTHDILIIANIILVEDNKIFKVNVKFSPKSTKYYHQNFLINFEHWDEFSYFDNDKTKLNLACFSLKGLRYAIISGFDVFFDDLWKQIDKQDIHVVLISTVCTFNSQKRWRDNITFRSLTHNVYILRANAIGKCKVDEEIWEFYGDSLISNCFGKITNSLTNEEELLITKIDKQEIIKARKIWNFKQQIQIKGL